MQFSSIIIAITIVASTLIEAKTLKGAELWEVSKTYLKDPFKWPSVWKNYSQSAEGLDSAKNQAMKNKADYSKPSLAEASKNAKAPSANELRVKAFRKKIDGLPIVTDAKHIPIPDPNDIKSNSKNTESANETHYFARELIFDAPFFAFTQHGKIYPDETSIKYSPSNESAILQLYEEIKIGRGSNDGVKVGDLYKIFESGDMFHHFTSGDRLGKIVTTQGVVKITRVNTKNAIGVLVQCFGTISREARATPVDEYHDLTGQVYSPLPNGDQSAHVVFVVQQQQVPEQFGYLLIDEGANKGFKLGDVLLIYNSTNHKVTDKVLASGVLVNVGKNSATVFLHDIFPGIINRGDFAVAVQSLN